MTAFERAVYESLQLVVPREKPDRTDTIREAFKTIVLAHRLEIEQGNRQRRQLELAPEWKSILTDTVQ